MYDFIVRQMCSLPTAGLLARPLQIFFRQGLDTSAKDCIMIALARRADHSPEMIRRIRHRLKRLPLIRLFCCPPAERRTILSWIF